MSEAYINGYKLGFNVGCEEGIDKKLPSIIYEALLKDFNEIYANDYKEGYAIGYLEGYWGG